MICQWGKKNNLNSNRNETIFLTPLVDHFACFKQKHTSFSQIVLVVLGKNSLHFDFLPQKTRHKILWYFTTQVNAS